MSMVAISELFINAVFTGMGTGIGSYIATRYAIKQIEKAEEKILKRERRVP